MHTIASAGISITFDIKNFGKNFGGGKTFFFKTHSQAKTHREACGGGCAY
jgi:hypothetical protein